jgi:hypothetical protein
MMADGPPPGPARTVAPAAAQGPRRDRMSEPERHCRQNMDAMVAFRMLTFPVPPLPLVSNQGEDARDATASSWDLLASAMRCQLLRPEEAALDAQQRTAAAKALVMKSVFERTVAVWELRNTGALSEAAALDECYAVWQDCFRQYFAFFPGSADLRFRPLGDVDIGGIVHAQTRLFLRNQASTVVDDGGVLTDITAKSGATRTYPQMLQRYAEELHAQAQEELWFPGLNC